MDIAPTLPLSPDSAEVDTPRQRHHRQVLRQIFSASRGAARELTELSRTLALDPAPLDDASTRNRISAELAGVESAVAGLRRLIELSRG